MMYCNPPALGRDSAYIIITCPLSGIYAQLLMSATGHTLSEFTPGYPCPLQSAPHGSLSGQLSCQDPTLTVGLVILPGLHAWWHTIRDTGPNQEVGTTQASLAGTPPHSTEHEWHMVQSSQHNNMYEELVEGCGASSGLDITTGKWGATWVSLDGVVVQTIEVQGKCI